MKTTSEIVAQNNALRVSIILLAATVIWQSWEKFNAYKPLNRPPVSVQINFSDISDAQAQKLLDATLREFDKRGILPPPDFQKNGTKIGKL